MYAPVKGTNEIKSWRVNAIKVIRCLLFFLSFTEGFLRSFSKSFLNSVNMTCVKNSKNTDVETQTKKN